MGATARPASPRTLQCLTIPAHLRSRPVDWATEPEDHWPTTPSSGTNCPQRSAGISGLQPYHTSILYPSTPQILRHSRKMAGLAFVAIALLAVGASAAPGGERVFAQQGCIERVSAAAGPRFTRGGAVGPRSRRGAPGQPARVIGPRQPPIRPWSMPTTVFDSAAAWPRQRGCQAAPVCRARRMTYVTSAFSAAPAAASSPTRLLLVAPAPRQPPAVQASAPRRRRPRPRPPTARQQTAAGARRLHHAAQAAAAAARPACALRRPSAQSREPEPRTCTPAAAVPPPHLPSSPARARPASSARHSPARVTRCPARPPTSWPPPRPPPSTSPGTPPAATPAWVTGDAPGYAAGCASRLRRRARHTGAAGVGWACLVQHQL